MISDQMKTPECGNQLDWTAFCYAAGELSADETAAFENRLGEDQATREALARAVELTQAVASAEAAQPAVIVRSRPSVWARRVTWMAIGSAASLLVAVLWSGSGAGSRLATWMGGPAKSPAVSRELAAAWMAAQEELAVDEYENSTFATPMTESEVGSESDMSELPETPAWMTIAVASLAGQPVASPEAPFDNERGDN
jgi:hypothetical protein